MILHSINKIRSKLTSDENLLTLGNKLLGTILTMHKYLDNETSKKTVLMSEVLGIKRFKDVRFLQLICTDITGGKYDVLILDVEILKLIKKKSVFKTVTMKDTVYIKKCKDN